MLTMAILDVEIYRRSRLQYGFDAMVQEVGSLRG